MQETSTPPTQTDSGDASGPGRPWASARGRSRGARILLAAGLVLVALFVVLGGLVVVRAGTPLPGTHVEGVDVSGLGDEDLRAVLGDLVAARQDATVDVTAAGQAFEFTPGEEGYGGDLEATVQAALEAGRDGPLGVFGHVGATFGSEREVPLQGSPIEDAISRFVEEVRGTVEQDRFPGSVTVSPETLEVTAEAPRDQVVMDVPAAVEALTEVIGNPDPPPVELPVEVTPPETDQADVDDAAERARRAVAEQLVLTANGGSTTLSPNEIARVLRSEQDGDRLVLRADADVLAEVVAEDLPALEVEPVDADFEVVSGFTTFDSQGSVTWNPRPADVRVIPSTPGQRYDPQRAAEQVGRLLEEGTREAQLELVEAEADLTTAEAEDLQINQLIGTFTTYHACCANRVTNIQRIADIVRGQVLLPGESFSVNDFVGQRTIEKGFVADGAIFRGEIRDEVGGGISQFATTMYNASFFAGIPILEHRAHSLYISRYPLGREATLNYDSIDLAIENDTDNGLLIHTSYTGTSITVSLFGNNGGRQVTANMGQPYNHRAFDTRTRTTPELQKGQQRIVQEGADGYQVTVERVISGGGADRTEKIVTTYQPKPRIVEVGTAEPPPPPPPPPPSPSPSPSPSEDKPTPTETGTPAEQPKPNG